MPLLSEILIQLESELFKKVDAYTLLKTVNDPGHQFELEAEISAFTVDYSYEYESMSFNINDNYLKNQISKENLKEIINYWNSRRITSNNPVMKFTYSILIWELKKSLTDKSTIPSIVNDIAETAIQIASLDNKKITMDDTMFYLNYALAVNLNKNERELIIKLKDSIMSFCYKDALLESPGSWYPVFFNLFSNKTLMDLKEKEIIDILKFINKLLETEKYPNEIIKIGKSLCSYYSNTSENNKNSIYEVLDKVYKRIQEYGSSGICMLLLYQDFQKLVNNNGYSKLSLIITDNIKSYSEIMLNEMNSYTIQKPKHIQDCVEIWKIDTKQKITNDLTKYDFEKVLNKIVIDEIPKIEDIISDLNTNSSLFEQIPGIIKHITTNSEGLPETSNAQDDNEESKLIQWLVKNIFNTSSFFFRFQFQELFTQYSESQDRLSKLVMESTYLKERHKEIINMGLKFHFNKNYIASIHLFLPQIEDILRNIVVNKGGVDTKLNRVGGYDKLNLDELLRSNEIKNNIDKSLLLYIKAILSHRHGYNLRNNVCHGLMDNFNDLLSFRLLHIIFCLIKLDI